ncbi:MAG: hypothetical protein ACFHWX_16305 [Bacteroidota bacterium]
MKRFFALTILFVTSLATQAQHAAESAAAQTNQIEAWDPETKKWLLIFFTIATVVIVLRTFRNKAEV